MRKVIIMRGLPGSGKSTWINKNYPMTAPIICSADQFFTSPNGEYVFDATRLREAHDSCFRKFFGALQNEEPIIIVDNTNLTQWEVAPYYRLAEIMTYEVEVIHLICDPKICGNRNKHGVPVEKVIAMSGNKQFLPPRVKETKIDTTNQGD